MNFPQKPWVHNQQAELVSGIFFQYNLPDNLWNLSPDYVIDLAKIEAIHNMFDSEYRDRMDRDSDIWFKIDEIDSDLAVGLYLSADSDFRTNVPIVYRNPDGSDAHGNLKIVGTANRIATSIISSESVPLTDAGDGSIVQPYTQRLRVDLTDSVVIKDNLNVGNDLEVGHHLQVGETLTIDSDLAYFNNRLQVRELATFDSDVIIKGQLTVDESSTFNADVRFNRNIWVGGDSTAIQTQTLRIDDNLITLSNNNDNAGIVDTGFIFQRYDQTNGVNTPLVASDTVYNVAMVWDETNDLFKFGETVSSDSDQVLNFEKTYATIARDYAFFNTDVEIGGHLQVGENMTVDSDLVYINNNLQVHETLVVDSDVHIKGQLIVDESSTFNADVRFNRNIWIGGDSTYLNTDSLRVKDNLITLSTNADGAPLTDTGLIFQRFDRTDGINTPLAHTDALYNPFMVWDEANDKFTFGETVSSDSEQVLVKDRIYAEIGRGEFVLYDSENDARVTFEKATDWPDDVRVTGGLGNPNERPTVEPDYEFVVKANASFGRDSDDVVVFNSRIMSNLIPFGDERYSLGDSDNKWKDLYLAGNTIYLGSVKIKDVGGQVYFTDSDDNRINLDGSAFAADSITVDSDLSIGGNSLMLGELQVRGHAEFDSDVRVLGTFKSDSFKAYSEDGDAPLITFHDTVYLEHGLAVDSDVILSGDLRVDSDVIIKGTMSVGQQVTFSDDAFFMDNAYFDSDVNINGILDVDIIQSNTGHTEFHDDVIFREKVIFDSDVVISNDLKVDSDAIIQGELYVGENVEIHDTLYVKGHATFDSDVTIKGSLSLEDLNVLGDFTVRQNVYFDSDLNVRGNLIVQDHVELRGHTRILESLTVDSDVFISADLRVDSDVIIKGTMSVGQEATFSDDVFFMDNAYFDSDVMIKGSLTVNGTTTYVNSQNLEVRDNLITLNYNQATPFNDTGFIFTRYDSDSVSAANFNTTFIWDETLDAFVLGETSSSGILPNPVVTQQYVTIGSAGATEAPFVFDISGASDPDGAGRPTLTGDGTGVIDGGTF